jgi:hypothetical protein
MRTIQQQNKENMMKSRIATLLIRPLTNPSAAMIEDILGALSLFLLLFVGLGFSGTL